MPKEKTKKTLFSMEDKLPTADRKGYLFHGYVGGFALGAVVAANKTAGRKKLLSIARKMLT